MKRIHMSPTPLDGEVEAFLLRLGQGAPMNHVVRYTVTRGVEEPYRIAIDFIADAEFESPAEQAQGQAEESPEPPPSLGAHLAGLAGDSVFTKPALQD